MTSSRSNIILVIAAILFVCAAAGLYFAITEIDAKGLLVETQIQEIQNSEEIDRQLRRYTSVMEETVEDREQLLTYILAEDNLVDLLTNIEEIANNKNLKLTPRKFDEIEEESKLSASFEIIGRDEAVMDMLKLFETAPYQSNISRVQFTRSSEETTLNIDIDFSLAKND